MDKDLIVGEAVFLGDEPVFREILIPEGRTKAAAAEVRKVNGRWKAVRLDGEPRWEDIPPAWPED